MTVIDDFLEKEKLKMNWLDKLAHSYPKIRSTKGYPGVIKISDLKPESIIKPSFWIKLGSTLLFIPVVALWCMLLIMVFVQTTFLPQYIFSLAFVTFMAFIISKHSIFNKKYFYNITLTHNDIILGRKRFLWSQVEDTGILVKREGKVWVSYLIIFGKDHSTERFSLFRFSIADAKIAAMIEYYKSKGSYENQHAGH